MREILFRGKEIDNREWVYGYVVSVADISRATIYAPQDPKECDWATLPFLVDPDTVGQFTGLLDKNGNKIFEGDILKTEYSKVICEFGSGDFSNGCHSYQGWCFTDLEQDDSLRSNYNDSRYVQEYSVIGNKWDNPELLNP